jgi:multimeric flavodoxin WrbA
LGKKILILNGSPRKNGNTATLIEHFSKGAEQAGHTLTRFNLSEMSIHPCLGCLKGGKTPGTLCTHKDDMDKIYPVYQETDIIVFASPLYFWSFSAQLKTALDRLFAVTEALGHSLKIEAMLLIAAADAGEDNFKPLNVLYDKLLKYMDWTDIGRLFAGGVYEIGDIKDKPILEEVQKFGEAIK